jgi:hypothetical protein
METPWGPCKSPTKLADGVASVSTSSHGGILVSAAVHATWPETLRSYNTFAGGSSTGGRWFEEDEDWAVVALAMPHLFEAVDLYRALRTARNWLHRSPAVAAFFASDTGRELLARVDAWAREQAEAQVYEQAGGGTFWNRPGDHGWDQRWRGIGLPADAPCLVTRHRGDIPVMPATAARSFLESTYGAAEERAA